MMGPNKVLVDMQANKYLESARSTAIDAARKLEWDGEGLPPVNLLCEWRDDTCTECKWVKGYLRAQINTETGIMLVIEPAGGYALEWRGPCVKFRPIRSEAEKKRAEGVIALSRVDPNVVPFEYGDKNSDGSLIGSAWYELYDAIAAGKIPHIRIY
ncbi:hypothetical protein ACEV7C_08850 [Enterobacter ludwigii]|uniref:hypothetical protein n=1 Tax=Enterobacter ludwigii TaxID=299767 RepID=UPI003BEECC59